MKAILCDCERHFISNLMRIRAVGYLLASGEPGFHALARFYFQPFDQSLIVEFDALDAAALQLFSTLRITGLQAEVKTYPVLLAAKVFA